MIDIQYLRENPEEMRQVIINRHMGLEPDVVGELLELDTKRLSLLREVEQLRAQQNELSSQIASEKTDKLLTQASSLKRSRQSKEDELAKIEIEWQELHKKIPNQLHPDVPFGKDEAENVVSKTWGDLPTFDFEPLDHVDLGTKLDIIDVETSAGISGARFNYLKNEAVLMQFGLIQYVLQLLTSSETVKKLAQQVGNKHETTTFVPIVPPVMVRPEIMSRMDRLEPAEERFWLRDDDLVLVGSAEHSLGPLLMDTTLDITDLPLRYIGYSTSFRREAGSYGKDTRGILRVHQFDKLEMMSFAGAEDGAKEQELFVAIQEHILQQLQLPYQVMHVCSGDTGRPDYRQIDINTYMPGQNAYRETHTSDYNTDYQARRLNTRYQDEQGNKRYVHMNDATVLALGRILIAIIENNQQEDGSVTIPEILRPFVGLDAIKPKN